jgi:hypothetical protein
MNKKYFLTIILFWTLPAFDSHSESIGEYCGNIVNGGVITASCPGDRCCVCNDDNTTPGESYYCGDSNAPLPTCKKKGFACYPRRINRDRCEDGATELWFETVWSSTDSYHGILVCSNYNVPGGSWSDTCKNWQVVSDPKNKAPDASRYLLKAQCYDGPTELRNTSLDLRTCETNEVNNIRGKLKCVKERTN